MGKASTSMLQRRLRIGYGRAASILDNLEDNGIIGPSNGSKPREVLVSKEQYEALLDQGISGVSLHNKEESEAPDNYLNNGIEDDYSEDNTDNQEKAEENSVEEVEEEKIENFVREESDENLNDNPIEDGEKKHSKGDRDNNIKNRNIKKENKTEDKDKGGKDKKEEEEDSDEWFDEGMYFSK